MTTRRGTTSISTTASVPSVQLTVPATAQTGDTAYASIGWNHSTNANDIVLTASNGGTWTTESTDDYSTSFRTRLYSRVLTGTDAGAVLTFTVTPATLNQRLSADLWVGFGFASVDGITVRIENAGAVSVHTAPTITGTGSDSGVAFWLERSSTPSTTITAPSGYSLRQAAFSTGNGSVSTALADNLTPVPPGPVGGGTWDTTPSAVASTVMYLVALKEAPAVTGLSLAVPPAVVDWADPDPALLLSDGDLTTPAPIVDIITVAPIVSGAVGAPPLPPPLACSATYDPVLDRIRITTNVSSGTVADVERSTDLDHWTMVRGGVAAPLVTGSLASPPVTGMVLLPAVDDYEFVTGSGLPSGQKCPPGQPAITNYYRVTPYTPPASPNPTSACIVSIVPPLTSVWLKSIFRPFLNLPVTVLRPFDTVTRPNRGAAYDIVGRSLPVAISDVRGSRRWACRVCVADADAASDLDLMLASGDPLYLEVPNNSNLPVPTMHVMVDETSTQKVAWADQRTVNLPVIEIAGPTTDVLSVTSTYQTLLDSYGTYQNVFDGNPNYLALLNLIADASEVIVP